MIGDTIYVCFNGVNDYLVGRLVSSIFDENFYYYEVIKKINTIEQLKNNFISHLRNNKLEKVINKINGN